VATCLDIITDALVEISEIGFGATPQAEEASRALDLLQGIYDEFVTNGSFGSLTDHIATGAYTAKEQQRILNDGYTITLPATIDDEGAADIRPPYDLSLVIVTETGVARQVSIYDANKAAWVRLDGLELTTAAPLSDRGRQGLACLLAKRCAGNRAQVSPQSEVAAGRFLSSLSRRPSNERRETAVDYY
jgi:hypothetical protein